MEDTTNFDESVTNTIQGSENKQKTSTTSIYLKPTTMRGIPLASLILSPVMRGFYITRSENDLPSSILADSTPSYTTTDTPIEQQTETTLISNISTTDETVTVIHNDQVESEPNALDNINNINNDKDNRREEKYSTHSSSLIFTKNFENLANYEKSDLTTIPIDKRGKSLRNFDHTTPLSNSYVVSSTTPTRRKIALTVSRYNEATTPLWTGRRIVVKKRNRTTVSPIKDAIRRTESDSIRAVPSTLRSASRAAKSASTLISRRYKLSTTSTLPTIPSIVPDFMTSPEILNVRNNYHNVYNIHNNNLANSNDTKIEDPENHATVEAAMILTNSIITATPSKIIPTTNAPTTADISTFSNDSTTITVPAVTNAFIVAVAKVPAVTTDATITTTSAITNTGVETTSLNYSVTDPIIENTNEILTDSAATIAFTPSTETEITSTNINTIPETTSITTAPSTIEIAETLAVTTENINKILTDTAATIAFAASTETEITSTNVNTVPEIAQTIATDSVTESIGTNVEIETPSMMTNYSTIYTISDTTNTQEITTDSADTITSQIINADIGATSTNYPAVTVPTTINIEDIMTDAISITAANTEIQTTSMIGNYSTFTTTAIENTTTIPATTTIPVTTTASPLTTVISSTANMQPIRTTAPMTASNFADANTVIANMITTATPLDVITSANNIPSTSAISETSPIINQSVTSKAPSTSTVVTSTNSAAPTTLTTEFSTIHFTNPNNLDISSNSKEFTATAESTQTTEIPTTFEIPIFTSTSFPKLLHNTNFESSIVTAALSTQKDKNLFMPKVTQIPSTLLPITTSITKETVASESSTTPTTLSTIFAESTNPIIRTTTNAYDADSVRTINAESIMPERKAVFKEATMETQSRTKDQIITIVNKPSSTRTSEKSTTLEMKIISEEATSKAIENRKHTQNQTSQLDTTNYQFSQKTARRRVVNRTNNWVGSPVTLQRTNQYPRRRVALNHEQSRRRPTYISSPKVIERNRRRRVMQKRIRVNSETFNSTVRPDQNTVDIQNTTEDHVAYDRITNVRRTKVLKKIKEKVEEETTTILPTKETTVFLQSSTFIENEMLPVHHDNGNTREEQKMEKIRHSQESFTTKETSTNISSTNESFSNNSQNNLHVAEDLSEQEKPKKIMKIILKNLTSQSEETNPIEKTSTDSDFVNANQDNFPERITGKRMRVVLKSVKSKSEENSSIIEETNMKSDSTDRNLQNNVNISQNFSDKEKIRRRMRVVLKSVKPTSEEKSSTIEETNVESDINDKNLQNNVNMSQNFSDKEKTRRRMRVILKRVKSEEEKTKTEEASTERDSSESLQGIFSTNFYSAKNFPVKYGTKRRMRVVLKSIKPKSEEKNSTIEGTTVSSDSTKENFQDTFSNNSRSGKNFPVEYETRRKTRVVLKRVELKSEKENSTVEETNINRDSINKNFQSTFLNNSRKSKNLSSGYGTRRRTRVILKSVKPKSEEKNSTTEETNVEEMNSDSIVEDLQDSFSSNSHINEKLSDEEEARRKMQVVSKSVQPEERDSVAEETNAGSQVLYTFHFSSNLHVGDNLPDKKKEKFEEKEAMTKQPEDMEPQTTRTPVLVEKDTDRPSLEVTNSGSTSRASGRSNRHRKPTPFTTIAPLTNTLSNTLTVRRRGRPAETTLSPRIDFVDTFEDTESYVKPTVVLHDQNADVSDQSIRAQEFAVTLSDPPSSDIGRTPLRNADRRKISTTITPRTDPTTSRTVSRYDASIRSRQRPRAKDRPTVNSTTRPRRPPVIDYDYYEDETPIIIDKSVLNSKLFLTSKGTVRCLDQGNFPHPYSCKKFITCARMVNGQVIGTEYTCPDKLSFDPVGGICNWSAGLGCKD